MMLFRLCSSRSLSVNSYMRRVRGAVLSPTLIRKRVDAFLQRSKRCGFCVPDLPQFDDLLEDSTLFKQESCGIAKRPHDMRYISRS